MNKIWYLSPSNQSANIGAGNYGSEKHQMNLLTDEIIPHLDRAGVSFHRGDPDMTIQERVKESNEMKAGFHLALHSNAGGNGTGRGPVAYYYSETGKAFAEKCIDGLLALKPDNNRSSNLGQNKTFYELKKTVAPACLLEVDFHDNPKGAEYLIRNRSRIAEAIARVIIEADGKTFVPETKGEYVDRAIELGLFSRQTNWDSALSKEEAAVIMMRLLDVIRKEVIT